MANPEVKRDPAYCPPLCAPWPLLPRPVTNPRGAAKHGCRGSTAKIIPGAGLSPARYSGPESRSNAGRRWPGRVREPLGGAISTKVLSATTTRTLPRAPEADYVVLRFQTSFQAKSEAIKTLTVVL
jgi:uncharacterized protein DUF4019